MVVDQRGPGDPLSGQSTTPLDAKVVLHQWLNGIKLAQVAHLRAAATYRRLGRILGGAQHDSVGDSQY
jgi:hypothetical protein